MRFKKKVISLLLFAALMTGVMPAGAQAAGTTVYLNGYGDKTVGSTVEQPREEGAQLSVSCPELKRTDTLTFASQGLSFPMYTCRAPVNVTLTAGSAEGQVDSKSFIIDLALVSKARFDPAKNMYAVSDENAAYFDGIMEYYDRQTQTAAKTTIRKYLSSGKADTTYANIYKGASVQLSAPGTYFVQTRYQALSGLCGALITIPAERVGAFTDVDTGMWFAKPVAWAVENHITGGTTQTTFSPGGTCTQAQIIAFMWRAMGAPEPTIKNPYSDKGVSPRQYYYKAMLWAYEKGIATDTALRPGAPCLRSDAVTYLWRSAGKPAAASKASFSDVPAGAAYAQAVNWAVGAHISAGTSASAFSPGKACTRAEIMTFLYSALKK